MKNNSMLTWLAVAVLAAALAACTQKVVNPERQATPPPIYPDYIGVTIPAGVAPLNFNFAGGPFDCLDVVVRGEKGGELHSNGGMAVFDIDEWHALTEANRGAQLTVTVCVEREGKWTQYDDFPIHVASHGLEEWGLTYRRVAPGYETYSHMGIYQRDLSNYDEEAVIDNTEVPGMCVNCHTANRTNPEQMVFHVRGDHGATMIQRGGQAEWLQAKNELLGGSMVYPYWHPSGKYCAFSTNQTRQGFHVVHDERIEVFDLSLCSISFDPDKGVFGDHVDTLFNAAAMGKSLTWPRPSYDGKYILFTLIDYGYFSIWHEEADQWLLDLATGEAHPVDAWNSRRADSYHNWSDNSRWVVFTSRRGDGLYSRLYLAYIDEQGKASKPFLLPQRNPWEYYDASLYSFNTPDFTKSRVDFDHRDAAQAIASDKRVPTGAKK